HTEVALGDLLASAATLLLGQAAEGIPAVLIRL
ncbi:MAG: coenzyme F420-0:L-glutamate ligase, partial [Candidatus Bathyarchaeia archaeon]